VATAEICTKVFTPYEWVYNVTGQAAVWKVHNTMSGDTHDEHTEYNLKLNNINTVSKT
jgi:hypothetical protein